MTMLAILSMYAYSPRTYATSPFKTVHYLKKKKKYKNTMTQFTKKKLTGMKCKFIEHSNMYTKIFGNSYNDFAFF